MSAKAVGQVGHGDVGHGAGAHAAGGRIAGGAAWLEGIDMFALTDEEIRQRRGRDVAHVFQDPLGTLHPLFTVGDQIVEAIQAHDPLPRRDAEAKARDLLALVRIPNPGERMAALSA